MKISAGRDTLRSAGEGARQAARAAGQEAAAVGKGAVRDAFDAMAQAWADSRAARQEAGHAGYAQQMQDEAIQVPAPGDVHEAAQAELARIPGVRERISIFGKGILEDVAASLSDPQTRETLHQSARVAVVAGATVGAASVVRAVPVVGPALAPAAAAIGRKAAGDAFDAASSQAQKSYAKAKRRVVYGKRKKDDDYDYDPAYVWE